MKGCGKSAPLSRQRERHGKPYRKQDQVRRAETRKGTFPSLAAGRSLQTFGNGRRRRITIDYRTRLTGCLAFSLPPSDSFSLTFGNQSLAGVLSVRLILFFRFPAARQPRNKNGTRQSRFFRPVFSENVRGITHFTFAPLPIETSIVSKYHILILHPHLSHIYPSIYHTHSIDPHVFP